MFASLPWMRMAVPALICALHLVFALTLGRSPQGSLASNLLQAFAATTAALMSLGASRRSAGFARRFWILVALAFAVWTAGQVTYIYHENWIGERVPQPSWSHFLFRLYGAPLVMALLITHEEQEARGKDWLRILDAAQVGILFLLFYFDLYFVPGGQWQGLTLLYVWGFFDISDLENWSLFLAFLVRSRLSGREDERQASLRFVPYLFAYACSSSLSNYTYSRGLRTGDWPDLAFTFSLSIGALLATSWRDDGKARPAQTLLPVVAWVPAILPLIIIALALPIARSEPAVAFVAVFGSVACFGARLVLTLYRRRRLMEALHTSEARYLNLLNLVPDAIFVHNEGRITFANPATARLLGLSHAAELSGRHLLEFAPPDTRQQFAPLISGSGARQTSFAVVRGDGERRDLEAVGMPIDATGDSPDTVPRLVIARDVTERRRAEVERESLIRALEAKNAELERFTYTVSHDLRSPLVTIGAFISHVEEAAERGDLAAMRDDLARIRRASRKMDLLLKDLLELSRVGHVMAPPEVIPFETLVRDAEALVHGRIAARGIELRIEPGLPLVRGDRVRLLEVVQNLLDNAAKFMGDQTSPRIAVGSRRVGEETVLYVRDNGLGIDAQHHGRVFGLFDKLDPAGEGTGLGLALVKRIVELHGGRIWVESEGAMKGTTFSFTLPLAPAGSP